MSWFDIDTYYHMQSSTKTKCQPDREIRELSPESLKYVAATPIAPSGTRRRPAKKVGAVVDLAFDNDKYVPRLPSENKSCTIVLDDTSTFNASYHTKLTKLSPDMYDVCVREVRMLDPRNDDKPIKEFSSDWLQRVRESNLLPLF